MNQSEFQPVFFLRREALQNPGDQLPAGWHERIDPRFRPVWDTVSDRDKIALGLYFLPHKSGKALLTPTRPRLIKWYCPFATQRVFPTGHRYCINVYNGCAHGCAYCYAAAYMPQVAKEKAGLQRLLDKDLEELDRFDVPPAPLHLSNSTDPFQILERQYRHTQSCLEGILSHRNRFTTVTVLTKNPHLAATPEYLQLFKLIGQLSPNHPRYSQWAAANRPAVQIEVSLAFWRDTARAFWDPQAPCVEERIEGIMALHDAGVPLVLRIDPLFPRAIPGQSTPLKYADFGLAEPQTEQDLEQLISLANRIDARHVVYSPVKIVQPRLNRLNPILFRLKNLYEHIASPLKLIFRGGSWRLPPSICDRYVTGGFLDICNRMDVEAKFCMDNLIQTP
jgi:DNA repair photolyase